MEELFLEVFLQHVSVAGRAYDHGSIRSPDSHEIGGLHIRLQLLNEAYEMCLELRYILLVRSIIREMPLRGWMLHWGV